MKRRWIVLLLLVSIAISVSWGVPLGRSIPGGTNDLQVIYYAARCLIGHGDPYQLSQLRAVYAAAEKVLPPNSIERPQAVTYFIYLPPTFIAIAPLSVLPWGVADALWIVLLAGTLFAASFLMVQEGMHVAPGISLLLACLVLANCEVGFALGNAAVLVTSFCTIAAWCFVEERYVWVGIASLVLAFAFKPHDAILFWIYLLLAGSLPRRRALQSLVLGLGIGLAAILWVSVVAPHWLEEWRANVAALEVPGSLSDPGPSAEKGRSAGLVIDLQAAASVLKDDPELYNPVSYATCGVLVLILCVTAMRTRFTRETAWFALAAVGPLTMLATYHRPYDAKILLLAIPGCARLWSKSAKTGGIALFLTTLAMVLTADLPLAALSDLTARVNVSKSGILERAMLMPVIRPAPLALLAMAVFYLWVYVQQAGVERTSRKFAEASAM
ncbi:MAG TPA: glycosyltransferase family 87 protein [Terracidiphilus sp.]|nr:glycosyltransferase family 87 protein [Terracidiphilus sp.]